MSSMTKDFRFWLIQFCIFVMITGLIYGCEKKEDQATTPTSPGMGMGTGAGMKGAGMGMGAGAGMKGAGMGMGAGAGMKGAGMGMGAGAGMKGAGMGMGAGAGMKGAGMGMGAGAGMKGAGMGMGAGAGAGSSSGAKSSGDTFDENKGVAIETVVSSPIKSEKVKNWDGTVTEFLRFKAKGPVNQTLTVHMPVEYKKKMLSKIGWRDLFLVYAMDEEARVDAAERDKIPDLSGAGDLMNDVLGIQGTTPAPGAVGGAGMRTGNRGGGMMPGMGGRAGAAPSVGAGPMPGMRGAGRTPGMVGPSAKGAGSGPGGGGAAGPSSSPYAGMKGGVPGSAK